MVVFLALVSHGENVNSTIRLDFKQRDVSGGAKRDDELSQEWIIGERLATRKRRETQKFHRPFDCIQRAFCAGHVPFQQKVVETQQIVLRLQRETDLVAFHRLSRALFAFEQLARKLIDHLIRRDVLASLLCSDAACQPSRDELPSSFAMLDAAIHGGIKEQIMRSVR